jgi:hypothetical protein
MPTDSFLKDYASRLDGLGAELVNAGVCIDPGPLYEAASRCRTQARVGGASWELTVYGLELIVSSRIKSHPSDAIIERVSLSVTQKGQLSKWRSAEPFSVLEVNISGQGFRDDGAGNLVTVRHAWHLDMDLPHPGSSGRTGVHPLYHIQFGGRFHTNTQTGEVLLLDTPRVLHPPVDIVLAIEVTLANYCVEHWIALRQEASYRGWVEESYEGLWKPHFEGLISAWPRPPWGTSSGVAAALWPPFATQ